MNYTCEEFMLSTLSKKKWLIILLFFVSLVLARDPWIPSFEKTIGNSGNDHIQAIASKGEGSFVLAGYKGAEAWILEIDGDGNTTWEKTVPVSSRKAAFESIIKNSDGTYTLCGKTTNSVGTDAKGWVVKVSATGDKLWEQNYTDTDQMWFNIILPLGKGYILAGESGDTTRSKAIMTVIDSLGVSQSQTSIGSSTSNGLFDGLSIPESGRFIFVGYTGDLGWMYSVDSTGTKVHEKTYSASEYSKIYSITALENKTLMQCGAVDNQYGFARNVDLQGNSLWYQRTAGNAYRDLSGVCQLEDKGYIFSGISLDTNDVWTGYLTRMDYEGSILWTKEIGNSGIAGIYPVGDGSFMMVGSHKSGSQTDGWYLKYNREGMTYPHDKKWFSKLDSIDIQWYYRDDIKTLNFEYAESASSPWISIVEGTENDGRFGWRIPNIPGDALFMRITSDDDPTLLEFPSFNVDNGKMEIGTNFSGTTHYAGDTCTIKWNATGITNTVSLLHSINGYSWDTVSTTLPNTGSYTMTLPLVSSSRFSIQLIANEINEKDTTAEFTIKKGTLTIDTVSRNIYAGTSETIKWTYAGPHDTVSLYLRESGSEATLIDSFATTPYEWKVPKDLNGSSFYIKAVSIKDTTLYDYTNSFNVTTGSISVTNFSKLYKKDTVNITWNASENHKLFTVVLQKDDYSSDTLAKGVTSPYKWIIPNVEQENARIKVISDDLPKVYDMTNTFPITSQLRVLAPNGGEKLYKGNDRVITWESDFDMGTVKLEYSKDSMQTWKPIAVYVPDTGAFSWRIPDTMSHNCKIRITSNDYPSITDESDSLFAILNGSITLTYPELEDTLYMGQDSPIQWNSTGDIGTIKIEYSLDEGTQWHLIESAAENSGMYNWTVPDTTAQKCLVRVQSTVYSSIMSVSTGTFVIAKPTITVTSPNWGEVWQGYESRDVTWESKGISGDLVFSYSIGDTNSWVVVDSNVSNSGLYSWRVPNKASDKCWVKFQSKKYSSIYDLNDFPFIIEESNLDVVTITADPIAQEVFKGDSVKLTITAVGDAPITYVWQKNGVTIAGATEAGLVINPVSETDSALYRCIATNPLGSDTSATAKLSIKDQFISVTEPQGGEIIKLNKETLITWTSDIKGYAVKILFSPDGGDSWSDIVTSTEDDGEFPWTPTGTSTEKAVIKIVSIEDETVVTTSEEFILDLAEEIVVVDEEGSSGQAIGIYPNPISVESNEVFISIPQTFSGSGEITIYDMLGQPLDNQTFHCSDGVTLSWDLCNVSGRKVAAGTYVALVHLVSDDGSESIHEAMIGIRTE